MDTQRSIAALVLTFALVGGLASGYISVDHDSHRVDGSSLYSVDVLASTPQPEGGQGQPGVREYDDPVPTEGANVLSVISEGVRDTPVATRTPGRHAHEQRTSDVSGVLNVQQPDGSVGTRDQSLRAYHRTRFEELGLDADYAWEVLRCESDNFDPAIVYGPRTGSLGEIGIGQLKPNGGLLGDFYTQGYGDPWNPYEQIEYISWKVSKEGWWAWSCAR